MINEKIYYCNVWQKKGGGGGERYFQGKGRNLLNLFSVKTWFHGAKQIPSEQGWGAGEEEMASWLLQL